MIKNKTLYIKNIFKTCLKILKTLQTLRLLLYKTLENIFLKMFLKNYFL